MPTRTALPLLLASLALLLAGCEEDAGCDCPYPSRCGEDGACTTACGSDPDCGHRTLLCGEGACRPRCEGVICGGGTYCEPTTGACVVDDDRACGTDADCGDSTQRCEAGGCVSRCAGVRCEGGGVCHPELGTCVGGDACETRADCGENELCQDRVCVGGRMADCSRGRACADGLACVSDGTVSLCTSPCDDASDCAVRERCADAGAFAGRCLVNLCRPGGGGGYFQDAAFLGACDAAGTDDGVCIGPFPGADGEMGICFGIGSASAGAACGEAALHGAPDACAAGHFCAGAEDDGAGNCLPLCSVFDEESCPDVAGVPTACLPALGPNGVCVPRAAAPLPPGESCGQTGVPLVCEEGCLCIASVCEPLCDPGAAAGEAGACAEGSCTAGAENPHVGVCR